nr:MAG TPA: hypothetical protein [Caudoviricetes sp.]
MLAALLEIVSFQAFSRIISARPCTAILRSHRSIRHWCCPAR